jgi:hypothetical protein
MMHPGPSDHQAPARLVFDNIDCGLVVMELLLQEGQEMTLGNKVIVELYLYMMICDSTNQRG